MKTIRYRIETGFAGASYKDEFEVPDNTADEEIDEMVLQELFNRISYSWEYGD